jgi:hypothetical protein
VFNCVQFARPPPRMAFCIQSQKILPHCNKNITVWLPCEPHNGDKQHMHMR